MWLRRTLSAALLLCIAVHGVVVPSPASALDVISESTERPPKDLPALRRNSSSVVLLRNDDALRSGNDTSRIHEAAYSRAVDASNEVPSARVPHDPGDEHWSGVFPGNHPTQIFALTIGGDGALYAGGWFNGIARWDGTAWHSMGSGMDGWVVALAVGPDGSLYAGGGFTTVDGVTANYIARWDGSQWHPLGSGMDSWVHALAVGPDGSVYAGGEFTTAGGGAASRIARWDGAQWHPLDSGMGGDFPLVEALAVAPDGSLYAGGWFTTAGGTVASYIARWNGSQWHTLGSGIDNVVHALVFGPDSSLYVGGGFITAGGVAANYIARWDGVSWHPLGSGIDGGVPTVYALAVGPDNSIYVGGNFWIAGSISANFIARWDGTSWHPLGSGMSGVSPYVYAFAFAPNGSLYAGGRFLAAGGTFAPGVARWTGAVCSNTITPPADPVNSSIQVQPASVPADGSTSASIAVQVRDAAGQPVRCKTVQLSSSRGSVDQLVQPTMVTNAAGLATGAVRSAVAGTTTISAIVMNDGVMLSNPAVVTFEQYAPPSGVFLNRIDLLTSGAIRGLESVDSSSASIAREGTFFRQQINSLAAKTVVDLGLSIIDITGGFSDLARAHEATQLVLPGFLVARQGPALRPIANLQGLMPRYTWNLARSNQPRELVNGLLQYGDAFFAEYYIQEVVGAVGTEVLLPEITAAVRKVFGVRSDGMEVVAYPAIQDSVETMIDVIDAQEDALLTRLPPLTQGQQQAYAADLMARYGVAFVLSQQIARLNMTLVNVHEAQQVGSGSTAAAQEFVARIFAKLLVTALFDGAGTILLGSGIGALDSYINLVQLEEASQMYNLAWTALNSVPVKTGQMSINTVQGLGQIALGVTPDPVTGAIIAVQHRSISDGILFGLGRREKASCTDVTIENTSGSNEPATFYVTISYLIDPGFIQAGQFLYKEGTVTIQPGGTEMTTICYKDGSQGISPVRGSGMTIDVLGSNSTGLFWADSLGESWTPTQLIATENGQLLKVDSDMPLLKDPVTSYVLPVGEHQEYGGLVFLHSPFTQTVPFTITQPLPATATPIDLNGGSYDGSAITWVQNIDPATSELITYTFQFAATPGDSNAMPVTSLSVISPIDSQLYTVESDGVEFQTPWPVALDRWTPAWLAPSVAATMAVTVTNTINAASAGSVQIDVSDSSDNVVYTEIGNFNVNAGGAQTLGFTLPATLQKGTYAVAGTLHVDGGSGQIFVDPFQVGLPSPAMYYQADPSGLVHPGSVLTYTLSLTNTTGAILHNLTISTSVPSSTTVIPGSYGGGVASADDVSWQLAELPTGALQTFSFRVTVNEDAVSPGVRLDRLNSEPYITGEELLSEMGPMVVNLVSICGSIDGDVTCDCTNDILDVQGVASRWGAGVNDPNYEPILDVNQDFVIDIVDIQRVASQWGATCPVRQ